jgi:hypothetical protein
MSTYRYLFADLLTNTVTAEYPLYGVWCTKKLSGSGNVTFSIKLGSIQYPTQDILENTTPGKTAFYIERDGVIIWGGIVWTRTYQAASKSLSFTGQTFESYAYVRRSHNDLFYEGIDQCAVVLDLWTKIQTPTEGNIDVVLPSAPIVSKLIDLTVYAYEHKKYGDIIDELVKQHDGFDWTIDVGYSAGVITKSLRINETIGTRYPDSNLVFEFPGIISNYYYPENASQASTLFTAVGAGDSSSALTVYFTDEEKLAAGFPIIDNIAVFKDQDNLTNLTNVGRQQAHQLSAPIATPSFEIISGREPIFGSYGLGDEAYLTITDVRFPETLTLIQRIVGWEFRPAETDNAEEIKLIIDMPNGESVDGDTTA